MRKTFWQLGAIAFVVCTLVPAAGVAGTAELAYTVTSEKSVDAVLDAVKAAARDAGLKVPGVHTLPAPGDYLLVELCDAEQARRLLATDPLVGLLLPCGKIGIYVDPSVEGPTRISLLLPSALVRIHPTEAVREMAEDLLPRLTAIVDRAR